MSPQGANLPAEGNADLLGGAAARMTSADPAWTLEQLQDSPLLAEGKVSVIGLDSVKIGMGSKWALRRQLVYENLERALHRQIAAPGFALRISETDYAVVQPAVSRLAGQAFCLNCLREVMQFFLGEALVQNLIVREVSSVRGGVIEGGRLDVAATEAAELSERHASSPNDPRVMSQDRWTPFVASNGQNVRVSCALEPVFQLKTFGRIGYRLARRVLSQPSDTPLSEYERARLSSSDIEKIDFATLARGLNRLRQEVEGDKERSLILPVSFVTLSSQRGRSVLVDFFRQAKQAVRQGLICEVCDIEGVPPSALLAATSLIRPFCTFIVGRLVAPPVAPLKNLAEAGLQGLSIESPGGFETDLDFFAFAKSVMAAARPVTKTVMFYRLSGPRQAALAGVAGATHGSLAPAQPPIEQPVHFVDAI